MSLGGTGVGGPEHLGPCAGAGGGRFGTWGFHRVCVRRDSMRLLDPIIHRPAKLPKADAAWGIPSQWCCSSWAGVSQVVVE